MKRYFLFCLALFIFSASGKSQEQRIEIDLMNCVYEGYADNGESLKRLISDYEQLLIVEKIISDNSGKSYLNVFQKIANREDFEFNAAESLLQKWSEFEKPDQEKIRACQSNLQLGTQTTKDGELLMLIDSLVATSNLEPYSAAAGVLSILNEEDLNLDYYKLKTFFVFSLIRSDSGLNREALEIDTSNLNDPLEIYLNEKNEVFVSDEKINLERLKELIKEYEASNKAKSHILLDANRETKYAFYQEVQMVIVNGIKELRNELSLEKYDTPFEELEENLAKEIQSIYPIHL